MDANPTNEDRLIDHLPWYNKAEFDEVAMQAYSDDYNLKRAAYNKMCVWKTRCDINQKLPFAVNCTMMILEAQLNDHESSMGGQEFLVVARDVQQYYFNAVVWYLSNVRAAQGSSHSSVGYCMNIIDWVLNLASADGLTPLNLLRTAAELVLKWLSETYWEPQEFIMKDYVLRDTENQDIELLNMAYFFKIWSSARVYEMAGIERVNQVPNEELRLELLTLLTFWYDSDNHEVPSNIYSDPELKDIMQRLLNEISHYLQTATLVVKKAVICKLLENRGFLSADVFLREESPVKVMEEIIISSLATLWYDVLKMIDSHQLTFFLLEALVKIAHSNESVHRSRMAALWVAQLTRMVSQSHIDGVPEADFRSSEVKKSLLTEYKKLASSLENNLCAGVFLILLDYLLVVADTNLPILPLQPLKGLSRCYAVSLGKAIVRNPNTFTPYILPGLLDCCGEHLPMNIKEDLLSKVGIHPKVPNEEISDMEVEDEEEEEEEEEVEEEGEEDVDEEEEDEEVEIEEDVEGEVEEEEEDVVEGEEEVDEEEEEVEVEVEEEEDEVEGEEEVEEEEEEVEVEVDEEEEAETEEDSEEEEEGGYVSDSLETVFTKLDSIMAGLDWCLCDHSAELENGEASTSTVNGVEASTSTVNGVEASTSTVNGVPYSGTED